MFLIEKHMTPLTPERKLLRRRIAQYGMDNVYLLFQIQQADFGGKGAGEAERVSWFDLILDTINNIREEESCLSLKELAVNGRDLMDIGFAPGKEIGACLQQLLELVIDEKVPNDREALLDEARKL